nr:MAG TPA: hypothetical protein [Caudoviricetes sp.]
MSTLLQSSILNTIKQILGIDETFNGFDPEIIIDINSALMNLHQIGIGPSDGFQITSESEVWYNLTSDVSQLNGIKTYIYLKTRLLFDPPSNSFLVQSIEKQIQELEWRLNVNAEGAFDGQRH